MSDTTWQIAGTGDFDGDGKDDILWRNSITGQMGVWFMDGTTLASYQMISFGVRDLLFCSNQQ